MADLKGNSDFDMTRNLSISVHNPRKQRAAEERNTF